MATQQNLNTDIEDNVPNSYLCPITHCLMVNPVLAPDGNTYEKAAIETWLENHNTSPMDNSTLMTKESLTANRALKDVIDLVRDKYEQIVYQTNIQQLEKKTSHLIPNITISCEDFKKNDVTNLLINIKASDPMQRLPAHICCTIDVSGSMSREAIIKNESGGIESNGLNLLDIVKHGVRTIIENLTENDYISIVSYSTNAHVVVEMLKMTTQNKKRATDKLNKLQPTYQTNFWDGLSKSLKCIEKGQSLVKNSSIFILTDGQANLVPPQGNVKTFSKYLDKTKIKCSVNTYGFGFYDIDSRELNKISKLGNGTYNYIADSSMVGTTFVNTLSNTLTTFESNAVLKIALPEGVVFTNMGQHSNYTLVNSDWGSEIKLGNFHYGQEKNIILNLKKHTSEESNIGIFLNMNDINHNSDFTYKITDTNYNDKPQWVIQNIRFSLLDALRCIKDTYEQYKNVQQINLMGNRWKNDPPKVKELIDKYLTSNNDLIKKYAQDINSDYTQVVEAIAPGTDAFNKWGKHYLLSLFNAHLMQECNNFKDPGVQYYGGEQFAEIRDKADEIFCDLPAPEPSIKQPQYRGSSQTRTIDMSSYNNSSSVCFGGSSLVTLKDGQKKMIKEVKKGDILMRKNPDAEGFIFETVKCLVATKCNDNKCKMVSLDSKDGGLLITSYHPILCRKNWLFPCSLKLAEEVECDYVYNLVLEDGHHIVEIGGYECVTLGHSYKNIIVAHDYFGTQKVIEDLKLFNGFNSGFVVLLPENIERGSDKRICGIKPNSRQIKLSNEEERVRNNIEFNGVSELLCS